MKKIFLFLLLTSLGVGFGFGHGQPGGVPTDFGQEGQALSMEKSFHQSNNSGQDLMKTGPIKTLASFTKPNYGPDGFKTTVEKSRKVLKPRQESHKHTFSEQGGPLLAIAAKPRSNPLAIQQEKQREGLKNTSPLVENPDQERPLNFKYLAIIMGVTIILALSLLSLAIYKNTKIKSKSNSLLLAKNKQLTKEKNKAEKAIITKNQFLSTITHELRTPIYAVTGLTHLLNQGNPTEEQKEYLNSLKFSGEHLLSLINNILDINKLEANKVKPQITNFNLKEKINNVFHALSGSANEQNTKLHLEIDDDIPERIAGDYVKLSQVMINLMSNAIRFTQDGDIWIRIKLVDISDKYVAIYFEIEDNGIGISEAKKDEIFDVFTQGSDDINNKYGGTGLGLPIVKGIIRILGGKIKLESSLGMGAKFYFTLKYGKVSIPALNEIEGKDQKTANLQIWQKELEGKRILIVEDNKINQMITHRIVLKHRAICCLADDGESALEKIKTKTYDLILMDLNMPGISGIDATKEIRKTDTKTPIIALTAVALDEEIEELFNSGFNDVIPKPYKIPVFFQKIYDAMHPKTIA